MKAGSRKVIADISSIHSSNESSRDMILNSPKSPLNGSIRSSDFSPMSPTSSKYKMTFIIHLLIIFISY